MNLLGAAGVRVEIRSALARFDLGGEGGAVGGEGSAPAGPGWLDPVRWLRPDVRVTAGGVEVARWKPAGSAPAVPWLGVILGVGVPLGLVGLGWWLGRR